jgi:hypothetical protein
MTPSQSNMTADFFMVRIIYSMAGRKVNHYLQKTHFYANYKIASRFCNVSLCPDVSTIQGGTWGQAGRKKILIL